MNNLQVVEQREILGIDFKIYGDFDNPLFLAKDVATVIGYDKSSVNKMVLNVDEDEKKTIVSEKSSEGIQANTPYIFLTEDGLYEVLMQSTKPIAKEFKKKVKELLKDLRKGNKLIVNTNSNISEMINAMMPTLIQNTIQSTMMAMSTILEDNNKLLMNELNSARTEYIEAKNIISEQEVKHEKQLEATRELIGFKTKNTMGTSMLLKTKISDIKGYTIRASNDYHYQLAKQRLFTKYNVTKWEDMPISRYNEIHADIDSIEDLDDLFIN